MVKALNTSFGADEMMADGVSFKLGDDCKLVLRRGDITKWSIDGRTDAIVNAANELMLGGGGVDGAIHRAAGPDLLKACEEVPCISEGVRCPTGEAVVTDAFRLPVAKVIHTVGPVYDSGYAEQCAMDLESCYRTSLELARKENIKYIAFPAISCGVYRYPKNEAATTALQVVKEKCDGLNEVHFVLFEPSTYVAWMKAADLAGLEKIQVEEQPEKKKWGGLKFKKSEKSRR